MSKFEPIGLLEILKNINDHDGRKKLKECFNYDCTKICPGHMTYMEGCNQILDLISFAY
jgi:hypothetical protein